MPKSDDLAASLKQSNPDVQQYVAALESENAKLQTKIAKLEVKNMSAEHRISALEESIKENNPQVTLAVNTHRNIDELSEDELIKKLKPLLEDRGYRIIKAA